MSVLGSFVQSYRLEAFKKGQILIHQDDELHTMYYIRSGAVKTYNLTSQGEEKTISFSVPGELLPVEWLFEKYQTAPYYFEAFTDTYVYAVPKEDFVRYIRRNPAALYELTDKLVSRRITHQMHINALQQSKAASKALHALNLLAHSFGKVTKDGLLAIALPFSQQELANFMGLARETMSIELKKLERQDVLIHNRPYYLLNMIKLKHLLGQESDEGMPILKRQGIKNILYRLR